MFQSTPPRGGERAAKVNSSHIGQVSIHAPARGRTSSVLAHPRKPMVSIHAPARGRTRRKTDVRYNRDRFNPRPRAGANQVRSAGRCSSSVSIHAPARGRTTRGRVLPTTRMVSIHAPARGRTYCFHRSGFALLFQSTPPRGGERSPRNHPAHYTSFNPRPRAGANFAVGRSWGGAYVSIHAPARGRTWY